MLVINQTLKLLIILLKERMIEAPVLGIVLARSGSKGLKHKNIKLFLGEPLLTWPIKCLKKTKYVTKVILSTDSEEYRKIGIDAGAEAPFLRPKELSSDEATSFSVIEHTINFLKKEKNEVFEYVVLLEPTSPLTESSDISDALNILYKNKEKADSIVSVAEVVDQHPNFCIKLNEDDLIMPYNEKYYSNRRQELEKIFHYDGSFYISKTKELLQHGTFYHSRTMAKVLPKKKNIEIDTIEDLLIAEAFSKL